MNKICTSLEQSKKLLELGIDRRTSDMYYWCGSDIRIGGYRAQDEELDIPAWSLTALIGLIPNSINFGYENDSIFVLRKIENGNYIADYYEVSFVKDNPLDAAFEMVCWLKENDKI